MPTKNRCAKEWKEIEAKQNKTEQEIDTLTQLKHNFTAVLSADYQMHKLVSYWGSSSQPGATSGALRHGFA